MCEFVIDCPHFTPDWTASGFIVVRNQNIRHGKLDLTNPSFTHQLDFNRRNRRAKPQAGDIIFTREAPMGEVCIVPQGLECCIGQRQVLLRPKATVDAKYLFYALRSEYVRNQIFWNEGTGSTVSNVRIPVLEALNIPRLGRSEAAIGAILAALDDKIDLNRRMNETLETLARATFKDWFIDFGPTRAKMEGRAPYLSPEIWALFPDRLDDAEKPEGWLLTTLAEYAVLNPEAWSRSTYPDTLEYVDLSGTKWGVIETTERHGKNTAPSRAQRILRLGDTIVGTVRPGNGSFAHVSRHGLTGSTGFAVLRPVSMMSRELVYLAATHPENIERLAHLADGGAYPAIRPDVVLATQVTKSSEAVLRAFSDSVRSLIDRFSANLAENVSLSATRDLLLPRLISGEICMREAEREVEAVL